MEPVRTGIIGCGIMGRHHAQIIRDLGEAALVAVADVRADVARSVGEESGAAKIYDSARALIEDRGVEAVVIAMPVAVRTPVALDAFAAGKHVLLEKPVAMHAAEVERMIAARGDLVAAVSSCRYCCFESARAATEAAASGVLGEIRVRGSWGQGSWGQSGKLGSGEAGRGSWGQSLNSE